jgi:hypothetical protein
MTKINENFYKQTFKRRSSGIIDYLLRWDYFSVIIFTIFLFFTLIATYMFMADWRLLFSGIFITLFLVTGIISGVLSIKRLNSISLFKQSVVDVKQKVLTYKKMVNKSTKILMFLIPPVIVAFIPLGVKFIRNIYLYDYSTFLSYLISYHNNIFIYCCLYFIPDNLY